MGQQLDAVAERAASLRQLGFQLNNRGAFSAAAQRSLTARTATGRGVIQPPLVCIL